MDIHSHYLWGREPVPKLHAQPMSMPHRLTPIQMPEEVPEDNQSMSLLCSGACNDSSLALQHNPHSDWANHRPEELALTCPTSTPPPMTQPQPTGSFWLLFIQLLTHTHNFSSGLWNYRSSTLSHTAPLPTRTLLEEGWFPWPPHHSVSGPCWSLQNMSNYWSSHFLSVICYLLSEISLELSCQSHTSGLWSNGLGHKRASMKINCCPPPPPPVWLLPVTFPSNSPLPP